MIVYPRKHSTQWVSLVLTNRSYNLLHEEEQENNFYSTHSKPAKTNCDMAWRGNCKQG